MIVVKVGGSLFELPDLGPRLRRWLAQWPEEAVVLVPGGGPLADVVREFDRRHGLGEERSHWLALGAMTLAARFLASLVPEAVVTAEPERAGPGRRVILDALEFARRDEGRPGALPHSWRVTGDSVAARVAAVCGASLRTSREGEAPAESDGTNAAQPQSSPLSPCGRGARGRAEWKPEGPEYTIDPSLLPPRGIQASIGPGFIPLANVASPPHPQPLSREGRGEESCAPARQEPRPPHRVRLILLKSLDVPLELGWDEAGRRGLVDEHFAAALSPGIEATAVNFRTWQP